MKKTIPFILLMSSFFLLASCGSSKKQVDHDKVDKSFKEFKDRNPDSD